MAWEEFKIHLLWFQLCENAIDILIGNALNVSV